MSDLFYILLGGLAMSAIAMVGSVTTLLKPSALERILLPLIAIAAGTLLGGAFFHMIPEGWSAVEPIYGAVWVVSGFSVFLALELFLHWHRSHHAPDAEKEPYTYLVLIGDAAHNFLGGLGIGSTFLIDQRAGVVAWVAAAAHEIPQELGDFGILVHGGWEKKKALLWNVISALTFPAGALIAYFVSFSYDVAGLVLFGAGNFIYIAASDLIPEFRRNESIRLAALHFAFFFLGVALMFLLAVIFHG